MLTPHKEVSSKGYNIDVVYIFIAFENYGVFLEGVGSGHTLGVMDTISEVATIIWHYGLLYEFHSSSSNMAQRTN